MMRILVVDDERGRGLQVAMALCAERQGECMALNFEVTTTDAGGAPEWIELLPAGQVITGRDGRTWINDHPDIILAAFAAEGKDLPVDWEHSSELKACEGEEAPAAGWVKEMEIRDGSIWGRVEWTEKGAASISSKEYRYLSPVFRYEMESRRIFRITSCGLTNQPNLFLNALNNEGFKEDPPMIKKLLLALGLHENATEETALNRVTTLLADHATALNQAKHPSLDLFVPRADYATALNRAVTAEDSLKAIATASQATAINAEIDAALAAGKITPATKEYHVAACKQEGGLNRFKAFAQAAPVIAGATGLDGKKVDDPGTALNAEGLQIAAMFGNSAEDIKKFGTV
jgi:phage I-like protein